MNLSINAAARAELLEAAAWYEAISSSLGADLLEAFDDGVGRIVALPHAWHPLGNELRRFRLTRFPYGIIYRCRGDDITIVAFAHHKRRALYWQDRLRDLND